MPARGMSVSLMPEKEYCMVHRPSNHTEGMHNLPRSPEEFQAFGEGYLPALIGFEILSVEPGKLQARMKIRKDLLAPNGYLHAASVIALADTACGYGTITKLPGNASGFTTIELKSNFLGTCRDGSI